MDFKEIIDIIAYVLGALGLTGFGLTKLKQKQNGGTVRDHTKRTVERLDTIEKRLTRIETKIAVCEDRSKRKAGK
jgi:hypothetical protein